MRTGGINCSAGKSTGNVQPQVMSFGDRCFCRIGFLLLLLLNFQSPQTTQRFARAFSVILGDGEAKKPSASTPNQLQSAELPDLKVLSFFLQKRFLPFLPIPHTTFGDGI